ncbi:MULTISPECIES: PP2C family protein-serine/threonine phosphatase [unclassified Streptomyces]|uniref:PP2C family protein-serine/threonine phosphatase n=1 Tax=unclassified Streptomyces TaxID=2593676 RepID=UPI0027426850|nr:MULTISPECIES: PP2C family protein-serine/threonine phosphatase [unclassified Streptomyces]
MSELVQAFHELAPEDLPELLQRHYEALGITGLTAYCADLRQEYLIALPGSRGDTTPLPIDSSLGGWAYRTVSLRIAESGNGKLALWLPVIDGIERIGVLGVEVANLNADVLERCRALASLIAFVLISKGTHSDGYANLQRRQQMELPAEMVWAFLPPKSIGTPYVTSTAILEPAYNLGGDAFDHALQGDVLHAAIVDAMGHDLYAGLTSSVALAACRNARRSGAELSSIIGTIDASIHEAFPNRFATGVFLHVQRTTGQLSWANCGHPQPLLLRRQEVVPAAFDSPAELPLGWGPLHPDVPRRVHSMQLEPGDRVLCYTDGVVDARSSAGEPFGEKRFVDFILRATAAGEPAFEVLRRLVHAILDHQQQHLTDDATILLFEWHPTGTHRFPATL